MSDQVLHRQTIEGALAIAREMRRIHSCPETWTQGWFARGRSGRKAYSDSPRAVRFCLTGARTRAVNQLGASVAAESLVLTILGSAGDGGAWNDAKKRTFEDVAALEAKLVRTLERRLAKAIGAS